GPGSGFGNSRTARTSLGSPVRSKTNAFMNAVLRITTMNQTDNQPIASAALIITFRLPSDNPTCRQAPCRRSEPRRPVPQSLGHLLEVYGMDALYRPLA